MPCTFAGTIPIDIRELSAGQPANKEELIGGLLLIPSTFFHELQFALFFLS